MVLRFTFPDLWKLVTARADTDWRWHQGPDGAVMRRRVNGRFEYREMTAAEFSEFDATRSW